MPAYAVAIRGANFLVEFDGELRKLGFLTTREVEADDADDAETKAIDKMRTLAGLREMVRNSAEDSPRLYVTEMSVIRKIDPRKPDPGLTWYPDDDDDDE